MHPILRRAALFLNTSALFLAACSDHAKSTSETFVPATPSPQRIEAASSSETTVASQETTEPAPPRETPMDAGAIERRFLAAQNDPAARIAAIRELADATPVAALTLLNRLFPIEHREDVKSEMLAALSDLDHTKERDNQFALCTKALAAGQPTRIRYIAIHTLVDLRDPRARAILLPLQNDTDREIRAAAKQALSDLAP